MSGTRLVRRRRKALDRVVAASLRPASTCVLTVASATTRQRNRAVARALGLSEHTVKEHPATPAG